MAKSVQVRVLVSFDDVKRGDIARLVLTPRVREWIRIGLVEVIEGGEGEAGQGAAQPADDERVEDGAEGSVPASGEPGQSFGAGPYGAPA